MSICHSHAHIRLTPFRSSLNGIQTWPPRTPIPSASLHSQCHAPLIIDPLHLFLIISPSHCTLFKSCPLSLQSVVVYFTLCQPALFIWPLLAWCFLIKLFPNKTFHDHYSSTVFFQFFIYFLLYIVYIVVMLIL